MCVFAGTITKQTTKMRNSVCNLWKGSHLHPHKHTSEDTTKTCLPDYVQSEPPWWTCRKPLHMTHPAISTDAAFMGLTASFRSESRKGEEVTERKTKIILKRIYQKVFGGRWKSQKVKWNPQRCHTDRRIEIYERLLNLRQFNLQSKTC